MAPPAPPPGLIDKTVLVDDLAYRHPGLSVICKGLRGRGAAEPLAIMTIDEITENFALLDDWDDRYRYVIELGRTLEPLPEAARAKFGCGPTSIETARARRFCALPATATPTSCAA